MQQQFICSEMSIIMVDDYVLIAIHEYMFVGTQRQGSRYRSLKVEFEAHSVKPFTHVPNFQIKSAKLQAH